MSTDFESLIVELKNRKNELANKTAIIGFDGFIDKVVRAVKEKKDNECYYFPTIESFGEYILNKKGMNCSLEIVESMTKLGGNMPIMSNALGNIGMKVKCLGALGYPQIDPIFKHMSANCEIFSMAQPGYSIALEFNDGKIMLGERSTLDAVNWDNLKKRVGISTLKLMLNQSDIMAMVNWGELKYSTSLWMDFFENVVLESESNREKNFFFDFADFSDKSVEEIEAVLSVISKFRKYRTTILSLNLNESLILSKMFGTNCDSDDLEGLCEALYSNISVDILTIHAPIYSVAIDKKGSARVNTAFIEHPKLLTGGGDNYDAGFCAGQLLDLDLEHSVLLGNAVAGFYVRYGHSPSVEEILLFLNQWMNDFEKCKGDKNEENNCYFIDNGYGN